MTMPKNLTPEQQILWRKDKADKARVWQIANKEKADARKRQWYLDNRELCIKRASDRKPKHPRVIRTPDDKKEYHRQYYLANKEVIINRWITAKRMYMKNPLFRLRESIRTRVRAAFISKGYKKNSRTFQLVGCTPDVLISHIENQFSDGMTWDNKHLWHVDHKVPLSLATTENDLMKLCHYSNLQPLWATENILKSDNLLFCHLPLLCDLLGEK